MGEVEGKSKGGRRQRTKNREENMGIRKVHGCILNMYVEVLIIQDQPNISGAEPGKIRVVKVTVKTQCFPLKAMQCN